MESAPLTLKTVPVQVAEHTLHLTWNKPAEWRMGSLERPFTTKDLLNSKKSWAALCAFVWCCLDAKGRLKFPSPEHVAELLVNPTDVANAFKAFQETWAAAELGASDPKKGSSSTSGPSQSSS